MLLWTGEKTGTEREDVLARVDNMWEDCCGVMWVEVTWYYFPEELHCGRLAAHGEREVFESHLSDETEIASIVRKVNVVSKEQYDALPAAQRKDEGTYFCRYHYDPNRRKFMPIIQSMKKAALTCGLETFKAQDFHKGKDRLLAFPDVLASHGRTRSRKQAGLDLDNDASAAGGGDEHEESMPQPKTKFERANHALQLSTVPSSMPCRQVEQEEIRSVLREGISQARSTYLS